MIQRFLIICIITLAQILFLGHSIIPHHHSNHDNHHHQSGSHDHENDSEEENGLSHIFCEFSHADSSEEFFGHSNITSFSNQITLYLATATSCNFSFDSRILIDSNAPPENPLIYNFLIFLPSGLRAPPISFV